MHNRYVRVWGLRLFTAAPPLLLAVPVPAQTITVTTTSMTEANNGICTLPEAVKAINNQASYFGCTFVPSSQPDRIVLQATGSYTTSAEMTANRAMEIVGTGQGTTEIVTGGIWGFAARNGATLSLQDLTVRKQPTQGLPVMCLYVEGASTLEIDNVRVADCNSSGIRVSGAGKSVTTVTVVDSIIENNQGSGISNTQATLDVYDSVIRGNNGGNGGGIANFAPSGNGGAEASVYDSTIENNTATRGAGVYTGGNGTETQVHLYRSLLLGNVATNEGGGLHSTGQFTLFNVTATGNRASGGAGVYHAGAEFQIRNCTISGNGGPGTTIGGGVFAPSGGNRIFWRTIVANNSAGIAPDVAGSLLLGDAYNLIENPNGSSGFGGTDILGQDPKLGSLQSLGGSSMVLPLLAGSPAIDAVPASSPGEPDDQRGSPRATPAGLPKDGDDEAGRLGFDIGAFEQGTFESEFLTMAAKTSSVTHSILGSSSYSKLEYTRFYGTANGHYVTYAIPVLNTGTYGFRIRVRRGTDRGIYQVATANSLTGTYTNRGTPQDLYSSSQQFAELNLGGATVTFSTTGTKYIRFLVTGKHASSSSRNLYLDWIQLVKQ